MESLQTDVDLLLKDYSPYRTAPKWRTFRFTSQVPVLPEYFIQIPRPSISSTDCYSIPNLQKRQELKKSPSLLLEIQKFWLSINPHNFRAISKQVYLVVFELLYKQFPKSQTNPSLVPLYLTQDSEIDFRDKSSLTFCEFYDVLFDVIDSLCKSFLLTEYIRVLFLSKLNLLGTPEFNSLNLFNKLHLSDIKRPSFYTWMQKPTRFMSPEKIPLKLTEKTLKSSSIQALPPMFLNRISSKLPHRDSPTKWENFKLNLTRTKLVRRSITPVRVEVKKSQSFRKLENPKKKDPLSITPLKLRKNTFLLEGVIEERGKNSFRKLLV